MSPQPGSDNRKAAHRHAMNAWADFTALRQRGYFDRSLLNSISHHLRHAVYRTGLELPKHERHYARRRWAGK